MIPKIKKNSYGKLRFEKDKLISIVEQIENKEIQENSNICNSGIMIVNTKKLEKNINLIKNRNKKNEYYLTDLVEIFSKKNFQLVIFL